MSWKIGAIFALLAVGVLAYIPLRRWVRRRTGHKKLVGDFDYFDFFEIGVGILLCIAVLWWWD